MSDTPEKQTVHECIHGVKTAMSLAGISKDNTNKEQKFKFRSIDDVINALSDQFVAHRLNVVPRIKHKASFQTGTTKAAAAIWPATVDGEFDIISVDDGSMITVSAPGEAADSADKAVGKACSFSYKTAMIQAFTIPTEGMNDEGDYDSPQDAGGRSNNRGERSHGDDRNPGRERNNGHHDGGDRDSNSNRTDDRQRESNSKASGPKPDQLIAFVDKAILDLRKFDGAPDDKGFEEYISSNDFVRRRDIVKRDNPPLFAELDHAIGMTRAKLDDCPF